jgi:hypothetical protein
MDVHKDPHQARDRKEIRRGKKRGRSEEERPKRRRKAGAKKRDRSEEERQQRRRKTEREGAVLDLMYDRLHMGGLVGI